MSSSLFVPGQLITSETGYLRGHGSYLKEGSSCENNGTDSKNNVQIISSVAGVLERVNKLISVRPVKSRYIGEVGDLVVGRVVSVDSKRWKVDINGQKDAMLQLSSINLPGGVQRMRTYEDQLQMRTLFVENDLISAEIQNINSEGVVSLHTRSLKYGKLENGQFTAVPSALIKRLPQHYISLPCGIDVILGKNGYIWVTRTVPEEWKLQEEDIDDITPLAETLQRLQERHRDTPLLTDERMKVARVSNAIQILSFGRKQVTPESIMAIYNISLQFDLHPRLMLPPSNKLLLLQSAAHLN